MSGSDDTRGLWKFLTVETGVVLPEISGEISARMRGASRTPTAFVLEDPTAGAAFCPSVLPTCRRSGMRSTEEFVVETIESVGLLGRSWPAGGFGGASDVGWEGEGTGADGDATLLSRATPTALRDVTD